MIKKQYEPKKTILPSIGVKKDPHRSLSKRRTKKTTLQPERQKKKVTPKGGGGHKVNLENPHVVTGGKVKEKTLDQKGGTYENPSIIQGDCPSEKFLAWRGGGERPTKTIHMPRGRPKGPDFEKTSWVN